ncbi:MAG TPA: hypothetical protein VI583_09880 [Cyclobacteriaceae bacterium]|nr:hypothetical protein [Cyclobacteriaceae bacterium]
MVALTVRHWNASPDAGAESFAMRLRRSRLRSRSEATTAGESFSVGAQAEGRTFLFDTGICNNCISLTKVLNGMIYAWRAYITVVHY